MVKFIDGNMFDYKHDCYVNTINCVGAMGAGIALEFKQRAPAMYSEYKLQCHQHQIAPGDCWRYKDPELGLLVGLAVKYGWQNRIRFSWAKMAIRNFVNDLEKGIIEAQSIALPRIGSVNGGRGKPFAQANDNWPDNSENGYQQLQPFFLNELKRVPDKMFTIYKLSLDSATKGSNVET